MRRGHSDLYTSSSSGVHHVAGLHPTSRCLSAPIPFSPAPTTTDGSVFMHIAVLYQYGHNPDSSASARLWRLMDRWSRDHEVTLITSSAWRARRCSYRFPWVPPGVRLVEVPLTYENEMSGSGRAAAYGAFAWRALKATESLQAPDLVMASSTPLSVPWAGARLARRWDVPWVFEVRDLWPDFPIEMGAIPSVLHGPARRLERSLYRSASRIVTLSPDMTRHVAGLGFADKVETSFGGSDARSAPINQLEGNEAGRRTTLLYAGTLGRANAIPMLLETAEQLAPRNDHTFVFMGSGYYADAVRSAADRLPNVRFVGEKPRHETAEWFAKADISLVTFEPLPVLKSNSPSKFYDSLSVGTPPLVTNSGWTRALVEKHRMGWYCSSEDVDTFSSCLAALLDSPQRIAGAAGRALAFARKPSQRLLFDREFQAEQYLNIFKEVVPAGDHSLVRSIASRDEQQNELLRAA